MKKLVGVVLLSAWLASPAGAGEVTVSNAWARATAPGQDSAVVSLHITSRKEGRVVTVSSPAAVSAELHSMSHENGMMKMRQLDGLPLQAGQDVELSGMGNHLMLIGLKQPLVGGGGVPLEITVQFADKGKEVVRVQAEVRPQGGMPADHSMHNMDGMGEMSGMQHMHH